MFDVFLAHNSQDKPQVEYLANLLRARGIRPWLDKDQIAPGSWFQDAIQAVLPNVKSAAIIIGPGSLGRWQKLEIRTFVSQCVENSKPVIPVLLPGVKTLPDTLLFLKELQFVQFQRTIDESSALGNLIWGILW
jgi:TIR domain